MFRHSSPSAHSYPALNSSKRYYSRRSGRNRGAATALCREKELVRCENGLRPHHAALAEARREIFAATPAGFAAKPGGLAAFQTRRSRDVQQFAACNPIFAARSRFLAAFIHSREASSGTGAPRKHGFAANKLKRAADLQRTAASWRFPASWTRDFAASSSIFAARRGEFAAPEPAPTVTRTPLN